MKKKPKKSDARGLAGLRPDTPLLRRNEMVSLKLTPLRFAQTGEPKSLSFRPALLDERLGLGQVKSENQGQIQLHAALRWLRHASGRAERWPECF